MSKPQQQEAVDQLNNPMAKAHRKEVSRLNEASRSQQQLCEYCGGDNVAKPQQQESWEEPVGLKPMSREDEVVYEKIMGKQVKYDPPTISSVDEIARYLHVSPDKKIYLYPSPSDDYKEWGNNNHRLAFVQLVEAFISTERQRVLDEVRGEIENMTELGNEIYPGVRPVLDSPKNKIIKEILSKLKELEQQ